MHWSVSHVSMTSERQIHSDQLNWSELSWAGLTFRLGLRFCKSCHSTNIICFSRCHARSEKICSNNVWVSSCDSRTCVDSSSQLHVSRTVTLHVTEAGTQSASQSQSGIMSWQHMPAHYIVCTWPGTKWTTQYYPSLRQKSHSEPHFSTHWWDRLTLRHTEGEVWVWQPATIISSCHYLPGHSQLCSQRQMHKHCMRAHTHTSMHTNINICEHTPKTHRTQLKVVPVHGVSLRLDVRLLDECCQLSWQK